MAGKLNLRDKLDDDTLDLSLMDLETVPVKEIATIKRFSHLDLSNNALVSLPKNFATLTQIVKLDLSKNMLTDLPDNFGELKNLKHLDLYSNQISRLPLSLGDLKNLKWLDLKENPLTPAVASVAGPCSNSAECQACARNIVAYLANAKVTIQEEKQRRIESLPAEENKKSPKAKRGRKKKSVERKMTEKAKVDSTDEEKQENNKNSDQKTSSRNSSMSLESQGGIFSSLCQVFISIILWSFFFFLLTTIAIIVLPLFDEKRSDETFKFIEGHTGVPIKTLRYKFILSVGALADNMKAYTNHAREYVVKFYKQYFMSSSSPRSIKS